MFSRLRSEEPPAPPKGDSSSRFKTLKHRLYGEGDEDEPEEYVNWGPGDENPEEYMNWEPPRKQRRQLDIAQRKKKGLPNMDEDDQPPNRQHGRRRLSPSPDSESPLVKEVEGRLMFSFILSSLTPI